MSEIIRVCDQAGLMKITKICDMAIDEENNYRLGANYHYTKILAEM